MIVFLNELVENSASLASRVAPPVQHPFRAWLLNSVAYPAVAPPNDPHDSYADAFLGCTLS